MQLNFPPDLEALVQKWLATDAFANAEETPKRAGLKMRRVLSAHIEEGFLQAERGELIEGDEAHLEIQTMKEQWLQERSPR